MGVGDQRHAPADLPPGKTRYPFVKEINIKIQIYPYARHEGVLGSGGITPFILILDIIWKRV
jgi:hypothetical protein